tara:strand:- start:74 stop:649 length:576 start_codon:yes stop_codon:yes gene_type:complete
MAHYAKVVNGRVINVIVADAEFINSDDPSVRESLGDKDSWIKTSYNTHGGKHYAPNSWDEDDKPALRMNFAEVGGYYDKDNDAFYGPQPYPSWVLDEGYQWQPPKAMPTTGQVGGWRWDENKVDWVKAKPVQPYPSWTYNEEKMEWIPPAGYEKPLDGKKYKWFEADMKWKERNDPNYPDSHVKPGTVYED